jgi:hypothetical protein
MNPDYLLAIVTSQRLHHQVAVNDLFCALVRAARASDGQCELRVWQGERRARRTAANERVCVRPDGYGVWAEDGAHLPFFVELDRGTKPLDRLAGKLDGYAEAEEFQQRSVWVLVSLHSVQRELGARQAMLAPNRPDVPVATTHRRLPDSHHPHEAVWWPLRGPQSDRGPRVRLVGLADYPIPPGALQRETAVRRWRAEEAQRKQEREADYERWRQERQAREEAARQAELAEQQALEAERSAQQGRWKVFGRWPTGP